VLGVRRRVSWACSISRHSTLPAGAGSLWGFLLFMGILGGSRVVARGVVRERLCGVCVVGVDGKRGRWLTWIVMASQWWGAGQR
jgi:hypothetical protein